MSRTLRNAVTLNFDSLTLKYFSAPGFARRDVHNDSEIVQSAAELQRFENLQFGGGPNTTSYLLKL